MRTEKRNYYVIEENAPDFGTMYYAGDVFTNNISDAKTYGVLKLAEYDIKRYELKHCKPVPVEVEFKIG